MDSDKVSMSTKMKASTKFVPHSTLCGKINNLTIYANFLGLDLYLKSRIKMSKFLFGFYSNDKLKQTESKGKSTSLCFTSSCLLAQEGIRKGSDCVSG
jgi:hypothetical protein